MAQREKIGGLGLLHEAWEFDKIAPHNQHRLYEINKLLRKNNNELIIKINLGFGSINGALYPEAPDLLLMILELLSMKNSLS